jgi:hypothetical protein
MGCQYPYQRLYTTVKPVHASSLAQLFTTHYGLKVLVTNHQTLYDSSAISDITNIRLNDLKNEVRPDYYYADYVLYRHHGQFFVLKAPSWAYITHGLFDEMELWEAIFNVPST